MRQWTMLVGCALIVTCVMMLPLAAQQPLARGEVQATAGGNACRVIRNLVTPRVGWTGG